jgi:hypothetical protein
MLQNLNNNLLCRLIYVIRIILFIITGQVSSVVADFYLGCPGYSDSMFSWNLSISHGEYRDSIFEWATALNSRLCPVYHV